MDMRARMPTLTDVLIVHASSSKLTPHLTTYANLVPKCETSILQPPVLLCCVCVHACRSVLAHQHSTASHMASSTCVAKRRLLSHRMPTSTTPRGLVVTWDVYSLSLPHPSLCVSFYTSLRPDPLSAGESKAVSGNADAWRKTETGLKLSQTGDVVKLA